MLLMLNLRGSMGASYPLRTAIEIHVQSQQQLQQDPPDFSRDFSLVCLIGVNTVPAVGNFPDAENFKKLDQGDGAACAGIYFYILFPANLDCTYP